MSFIQNGLPRIIQKLRTPKKITEYIKPLVQKRTRIFNPSSFTILPQKRKFNKSNNSFPISLMRAM